MSIIPETSRYTLGKNIPITFGQDDFAVTLTGDLVYMPWAQSGENALVLVGLDEEGPFVEHISTNLTSLMLYCFEEDVFWIKNWSEHTGLAEEVAKTGLVEIVRETSPVTAFGDTATMMRVVNFENLTPDAPTAAEEAAVAAEVAESTAD